MNINISPKVDSNSQRRVQCSIPKCDKLFELFPHLVISRTQLPVVRGITITQELESKPRTRNVKIQPIQPIQPN
jgi:CheY-like chemotaxis protein